MQPRRPLDAGPLIVIPGALLLLASLFVDWYEPGLSAFTVFEVLDLVLAAIAIACLIGAAERLGTRLPGGRLLSPRLAPLGLLALVIVGSQAIDHPPAAVDRDPEIGLWLALGGAALLALGALLSAHRISLAIDVEPHEGGRSGATGPREAGAAQETAPLATPPPGGPQR